MAQAFEAIINLESLKMSEEMERCDNCLKMFPEAKIATHFGYCRRNIKRCEKCGEMYDINYVDEHEEQFHKKVACEHCKREFGSGDIEAHTKNCHHKPKFCQYCEQKVPPQQFNSHLAICQSRTKTCDKCNQPISNKEFLIHLTTCQGPKVEEKKSPTNYEDYLQGHRKPEPKNVQSKYPYSRNLYPKSPQPKNQYAKVNYEYKPYGQRNDTQDYQKWAYKQERKGYPPSEKKQTDPIKEKSKYTGYGAEKAPIQKNYGKQEYGSNYQIPGRSRNDPQVRRDDPQVRRDDPKVRRDDPQVRRDDRKVPSYNGYNALTNPTGNYKVPHEEVTNAIGRINRDNYKPSSYNQGQPSSYKRDEGYNRQKPKVYDYKRQQIKVPSSHNIPSYNYPKARNTGTSTEQTSYSSKNLEKEKNPNPHNIPSSNHYHMASKRQYPKPEPKRTEKKQWRPEDYGGYIADGQLDLNRFEEETRPNLNNYQPQPPFHDSLQNEDAELQKAIMMSIGEKKSLRKPKNVPKQLQNLEQMSQSFYRDIDMEKQQALYEEAQNRGKKRY